MSFLTQLYPHERSPKRDLCVSLITGAFIFLFLLIFKPFGIADWQTPWLSMKLAGFGIVTSLVLVINYFILPLFIRLLRNTEEWTVGYELLSNFIIVSTIAICNYAYLKSAAGDGAHFYISLPEIYGYTFLIGIFPVSGLICLNYILQLNKYKQLASALPVHPLTENPQPIQPIKQKIDFAAENGIDKISVRPNELIYIEAEDNYVGINYFQAGIQVKRLLRNTLSCIENQQHTPALVRCHRSFLVNLYQVEKVTGNAQGFRFCIRDSDIQVPVGRKYNAVVQQYRSMISV